MIFYAFYFIISLAKHILNPVAIHYLRTPVVIGIEKVQTFQVVFSLHLYKGPPSSQLQIKALG